MIRVIAFDRGDVCGFYELKHFDNFLKKNNCKTSPREYFKKYKGDFDKLKLNEKQFWNGLKQHLNFEGKRQLLAKNNQKNLIIDLSILEFIKSLRKKYHIILWSNNDPTSTKQIINEINLKTYFENCYLSREIKSGKTEKTVFDNIVKEYNCLPGEILFIDDFIGNINKIKMYGAKGLVYKNLKQLNKDLKQLKIL